MLNCFIFILTMPKAANEVNVYIINSCEPNTQVAHCSKNGASCCLFNSWLDDSIYKGQSEESWSVTAKGGGAKPAYFRQRMTWELFKGQIRYLFIINNHALHNTIIMQ